MPFDGPLPIAATFSKDPKMWAQGFEPREVKSGLYARVLGVDGKAYIDWVSSLGANLIGHNRPEFTQRLCLQLLNGIGFSLPHTLERQVAEKIVNLLGTRIKGWAPGNLGVRFGLSGTDATTMSVRLARAVTGRKYILSSGFHGWADWSISVTPPAWGIPENQYVIDFNFNDIDRLAWQMEGFQCAAVILEQPLEEPKQGYYGKLRNLCTEHGALLIMDEVVTWPRYALGGACELYGIEPDIVCLGKSLGNCIPMSCIVGRHEYFEWFARKDPCFISSTHFGNAVSLAAADAVLDIFNDESVKHIWTIGEALLDGLREAGYSLIGNAPRSLLQFPTLAQKTYFVLGMRDRSILMNRPNLPNLAHTLEDVEKTVQAAREIKAEMERVDVEALMKDKLPMVLFEAR